MWSFLNGSMWRPQGDGSGVGVSGGGVDESYDRYRIPDGLAVRIPGSHPGFPLI